MILSKEVKKKIGKKIGKHHVIGPLKLLSQELSALFKLYIGLGGLTKTTTYNKLCKEASNIGGKKELIKYIDKRKFKWGLPSTPTNHKNK